MLNSLKRKLAQNHEKAAMRQLGISALRKYAVGLFFALLYIVFYGVTVFSGSIEITKSMITGEPVQIEIPTIKEQGKQQKASVKLAIPEKPYILGLPPVDLSGHWYFTDPLGFDHIAGMHKEMQQDMFAWEALTGNKIYNHAFMQPNPKETPKDDYRYYDAANIAQEVRTSLSEILDMRYKVESNYQQHEDYCKKLTGKGEFSDAVSKCLNKPHTQEIKEKGVCISNDKPVYCGQHIRDFVRRVYEAKTDKQFFNAWPIFHHNAEFQTAKISYELGLKKHKDIIDLSVADMFRNKNKSVDTIEYKTVQYKDKVKGEALRITMLLGAGLILFIYLIAGHKYAIIRAPKFLNPKFYLAAIPFLIVYIFSFKTYGGTAGSSIFIVSTLYIPVFLILTGSTYWMVYAEWFKSWRQWREIGVLGQKGGSGRWGGIREYLELDVTNLVNRTIRNGVQKENFSTLYIGKTNFKDDYQMIGRHIGVVSEQHHIICSGTGGGKSKDAITSILTMWNGGAIVFDVKGEHWNTTAAFKSKTAATHLLDPYKVIKNRDTDQWNPLMEIDAESVTAKADLERITDAIVFEDSESKNAHFTDIGKAVIVGFCAHVLTTYPEDKRHLGSVYDLFEMGRLCDEEPLLIPRLDAKFNPILDGKGEPLMREETHLEAINRILKDMETNEAIGGAAREAAGKMNRVGANERGSFYSTVSRSIMWVNDEAMRPMITGRHDFSVRDAKTKESWCYLAMPEKFLDIQMRFVRVFFQLAADLADNYSTERSAEHKRQTLFLFEEFNLFKFFKTAEKIACFSRSSGVKAIFVVQNLAQIERHYPNVNDFYGSCDKQFFSLAAGDKDGLEHISDLLGTYKIEGTNVGLPVEHDRKVLEAHEVKELIDGKGRRQIFVPVHGHHIKLNRVACFDLFPWTRH